MPKEKTTTRGAKKGGKADGGKKKKGLSRSLSPNIQVSIADFAPDPNMPKRGLSAYMFFANEQRDVVREENPGIKFGMSIPVIYFQMVQLTIPQARSASSSERSGRPSTTSRRLLTRPRPLLTRSVTRRRRRRTRM
jgi:hypothetical protein